MTVVPGGNPDRLATKVTEAEVMFPFASFVTANVIVTFPLPDASGPVTGGTSFEGISVAVNVGSVGDDEDGEVEDEHPAATNASATLSANKRFIVTTLLRRTCVPD